MLVTDYILEKGLQSLVDVAAIKVTISPSYPTLVCLNYDQIRGNLNNPLTASCRALILDREDSWKPVAFPFPRFPNLGENNSKIEDLGNYKRVIKLDGSLVTLFCYKGEWIFSTRSSIGATGNVHNNNCTFNSLIREAWGDKSFPEEINKCFTFELTSEKNKVIILYKEPCLTLIAVRDMDTLKEEPIDFYVKKYGWYSPPVVADAQIEGYVLIGNSLVDGTYPRLKIKKEWYVKASLLYAGLNRKALLSLVVKNEAAELLVYFPEYKEEIEKLKSSYTQFLANVIYDYYKYNYIEEQKDYAESIKDKSYKGLLFTLRRDKPESPSLYLENLLQEFPLSLLEKLVLGDK